MSRPTPWEQTADIVKDAPIVGTAAFHFLGVSLNDIVLWATAIWAVIRAGQAALDVYWKWKDRREQSKRN